MKRNLRYKSSEILENLISIGLLFVLALTIVTMGIAFFDRRNADEAYMGSFETDSFNQGWTISGDDSGKKIELPWVVPSEYGDKITIVNTLPRLLNNGMSLMVRSNMEDVHVYVDGKLRSEYSTESMEYMSYYIPSAYLVTTLYSSDSGKEIRVVVKFKTNRIVNDMSISYGNNVWFKVIKNGLWVNISAIIVCALGAVLFVTSLFFGNSFRVGATKNLGLLMMNITLWVLSESTLRQFIFHRPSLSRYFSYFLVELIGALSCMYFDEVQHRVYHKRYLVLEGLVLGQIIINILLTMGGIFDLYQTMAISQVLNAVCAIVSIVNIFTDIRTKRVREYHITAVGMIFFIFSAIIEFAGYHFGMFSSFGARICTGLLLLMAATVIQTLYDEIKLYRNTEKNRISMTINTIQTIASAIDARDEYTGGHSERVGLYAERLAREMAADYDFSEEDILTIHYVGLVHDIGKIGVADNVLNKPGKLNDEEYSLMKKHTEIGYEIMNTLGEDMKVLLDGIRYHHERFDGKGYPDGLSDTDIPLVARILAIADSYDAMTSDRVYRNRLTDEEVREQFVNGAGTQFDPLLVDIFVGLLDDKEISAVTLNDVKDNGMSGKKNSGLLETKLQSDLLLGKENILNPSHVRMLCYVMKLMEKKGKQYQLLFVKPLGYEDQYRQVIKEITDAHDVNIQYTEGQYIVAFYDKEESQIEEYENAINKACPTAEIKRLS